MAEQKESLSAYFRYQEKSLSEPIRELRRLEERSQCHSIRLLREEKSPGGRMVRVVRDSSKTT